MGLQGSGCLGTGATMLLHNRSSSAITVPADRLTAQRAMRCLRGLPVSTAKSGGAHVVWMVSKGGNPTMGIGRLKEKKHIRTGFEK